MRKQLFGLFILLITFSSCETVIKGELVDNFDQPVQGVSIKIIDSAYKSDSEQDGNFEIPFSPGKFRLNFQKENYLPVNKVMEVIDGKDYPMGEVKMTRVPASKGLFIKGKKDYIELQKVELKLKEEKKRDGYRYQLLKNYSIDIDNVMEITPYEMKEVELFGNLGKEYLVFEIDKNHVVTTKRNRTFLGIEKGNVVKFSNPVKYKSRNLMKFQPKIGETYVFVHIYGEVYSRWLGSDAYAVKVVEG
jgi:hypothetical protein